MALSKEMLARWVQARHGWPGKCWPGKNKPSKPTCVLAKQVLARG